MNAAQEERRIDVPHDLALRLSHWHSSMGDPVYAVSSSGLAKRSVPIETFEAALSNMETSRDYDESHVRHITEIDEIVMQMKAQLGQVDNLRKCISRAMARSYWAIAWADEADERGFSYAGRDVLEVAPQTPVKAIRYAFEEIATLEKHAGKTLEELYKPHHKMNPYDFGHEIAVSMMGLGCSNIDLDTPYGSAPNHFDFVDEWIKEDPI